MGQKIKIDPATTEDKRGLGPSHAVTSEGKQRPGSEGGGNRRRRGLRLRLSSIEDVTPRDVLRQPLYIPCVLGPDFEVEEAALHTDFDTVSAGQFSSPAGGKKAPQLKTLSTDILSLTWDAKWLTFPDTTPEEVRAELNAILRSRQPVELFTFIGPHGNGEELRMYATLRSLRRILRHGETDTRYYSLEWKQWRSAVIRRKGGGGGARRFPVQHKLDEDDTLRSLANRYYGTGELWAFLAAENGIKRWGSEDKLVKMGRYKVGDKIKIPPPPQGGSVGQAQSLTGNDDHLRIIRE
jgi:hypothetical protein